MLCLASSSHSTDDGEEVGAAVGISFAVIAVVLLIIGAAVYHYRYSDGRALYGKLGAGMGGGSGAGGGGGQRSPNPAVYHHEMQSATQGVYTPPTVVVGIMGDGKAAGHIANPLTKGDEEEI